MSVPLAVGICTAVAATHALRCLQWWPPRLVLKLLVMLLSCQLSEHGLYGAAACREAFIVAASRAPRRPPLVCTLLRILFCVPAGCDLQELWAQGSERGIPRAMPLSLSHLALQLAEWVLRTHSTYRIRPSCVARAK